MVDWNSFFQNWGFWIVFGIVVVGYAVYRIVKIIKSRKEKEIKGKENFTIAVDKRYEDKYNKKPQEENIEEKFELGKEYKKIDNYNETLSQRISKINNDVRRLREEQNNGLLEIKKLQKEIENKVVILKNKYISLKDKERVLKETLR